MSIAPETLRALDRAIRVAGFPSRSRAMEAALVYWLARQKHQQIEREVEAYYHSLTVEEKREDKDWAGLASQQIGRRKD